MTGQVALAPRRAVIDRAWREIGPGVETLSGRDGGPLTRTVKRIIDPLVLRLRAHPEYSAPVLDEPTAARLRAELLGQAESLRACAAWFAVLKTRRRALRITAGNAQELYFPPSFELAITHGDPGAEHVEREKIADTMLRDIHDRGHQHAVEALDELAGDAETIAELERQLARSWVDVQPTTADVDGFLTRLRDVHDDATTPQLRRARQRAWVGLVADEAPYELGVRVRRTAASAPWSVDELGLCTATPQHPPPVLTDLSGRPLDRSVIARVRATLRRSRDRDALPPLPALCAEEVDRASAPWGLLAEDLQATMVSGVVVAVQLAPLEPAAEPDTAFAASIQATLRKEAYVLRARWLLADDEALHPRQRQVVAELSAFARPYLARLWARLHGRDVTQEPCDDVDEMRSLLTGIARSVSLDHRQQIKAMLEPEAVA